MAKEFKENIPLNGLTSRQFLMLVSNVFAKLGWPYVFKDEETVVAEAGKFNASENVTVSVVGYEATIHSKCSSWYITDLGRNKKHVTKLITEIDAARQEYTAEQLDDQYSEIEKQTLAETQALKDRIERGELTASDKISLGIGGHYVTYALIAINVLVFIAMAASGVSILEPTGLDILNWGGNMRAYTASGEWWRLITSVFVHIGIVHLLLNMYALYMIGLYLEPILGRWKFLAAYLSAGVLASLTSLWWHDASVGAGASGAIFGMYGFFVALLTTNLIDKKLRGGLMQSMAVFVVYNLIYGLKGNIDNAAHIGGLVSGFILGYIYFFFQKKDKEAKMFPAVAIALAIVATIGMLRNYNDDSVKFDKVWEEFAVLEQKGIKVMTDRDSLTSPEFIKLAETQGIPTWVQIKDLLQKTDDYKLPAHLSQQRSLLKEYADLRLRYLKLWVEWEKAPDENVLATMEKVNDSVANVLADMEKIKSQ
jgi:rhomboid protease GluP